MKRNKTILTLAFLCFVSGYFTNKALSEELKIDAEAAKAIFKEHKCNKCHAINVAGIERLEEPKGKKAPPDLSGAGNDGDSGWIADFITKKEKGKHRKLHTKAFKGSPEQLETLTSWLASLKSGEAPSKLYDKK